MDTKQPEALRIADDLHHSITHYGGEDAFTFAAYEAEQCVRALHAENERLRTCNKDAQHAIANLQERVQQLGQLARDVNSRRVIELEAQLAAVGAGLAPGWQAVPVEPTSVQLEHVWKFGYDEAADVYRAMIAAAPKPLAPSAPAFEPPTEEQMHKDLAALCKRIFNARIGKACSNCDGGTYQSDNNGYGQFHRCSKCRYVPMWREDGRELGAPIAAAQKGGNQ